LEAGRKMKNYKKYSLLIVLFLAGCSSFPGRVLDSAQTAIVDCGTAPHCVSSNAKDKSKLIEPIAFQGSIEAFQDKMKQVLTQIPRTQIALTKDQYIHAEATSLLLRFTDDVEFYFLPNESVIHVRSSSRIGYSDFGVNRTRVEKIRNLMNPPPQN
jgi:uncharacterized protein (DUF1499 family)